MTEYKKIKEELELLRTELIDYINSSDDGQDLTEKFIDVRESDLATYELLMLIYQEFKTGNKINKRKLTNILDKSITAKIKTIDNLILESRNKSSKETTTLSNKIINALTFENIMKGVGVFMLLIIFMFTLYTINSEAYTQIISTDGIKLIENVNKGK